MQSISWTVLGNVFTFHGADVTSGVDVFRVEADTRRTAGGAEGSSQAATLSLHLVAKTVELRMGPGELRVEVAETVGREERSWGRSGPGWRPASTVVLLM